MSEDSKFCAGCGRTLEPGMQFCPQCGRVVAGSEADEEFKQRSAEIENILKESRMNWLVFALAVYAIPATISTLIALVDAGAIANTIWSNDDFQNWIIHHGYTDLTVENVKNYILIVSGLGLASGLLALLSMFCVIKRKMWKVAVFACLAAAILCSWSLFGVFAGLLVTWLIYSVKDSFQS